MRDLLAADVIVGASVVELQLRKLKYAETGVVPRILLRVPVPGPAEPV